MQKLPIFAFNFVVWWFTTGPIKAFIVCKRLISLANNNVSFTLNIQLLFTPIFGDYTIPGRIIGFFFRFWQVIFGLLILLLLLLIMLISPIAWAVLPFALAYFLKFYSVPIFVSLFLLFWNNKRTVPSKKLSQVSKFDAQKAIRPNAFKFYSQIQQIGCRALIDMLKDPQIKHLLVKAELLNEEICKKNANSRFCQVSGTFTDRLRSAPELSKDLLLEKSYELANVSSSKYIENEHIFVAAVSLIPKVENLLASVGSSSELLQKTEEWLVQERMKLDKRFVWQEDYRVKTMGGIGKTMTGRTTPYLDSLSEDFTKRAASGHMTRTVGRAKEISKIADFLSGSAKNILLIGEPGSGKTALVRGVAFKIVDGVEYPQLKFKRIVSIDIGSLLSGTKTVGEVAEKVKRAMKEVQSSGDIIVFIDEIHNLVSGSQGDNSTSSGIFSILEPYLRTGIQFIGATSMENYRKYIETNGSFSRMFEVMQIPPSEKEDTIEILKFYSTVLEKENNITITYPALVKTVELSAKLIHERVFPDKALDALKRSVAVVSNTNRYLTTEDISAEISEITNVPVTAITQDESQKLLSIENSLKLHVIGQDEAVSQVGAALKRARVGIRNENKPIASFLFVGTTGVGKTETAKALALEYFGDEKAMVRLDMSEYQQRDSINKLIGTPEGSSRGYLTEAVRTKPFSLILLDEVEKADQGVLLTFLQVLDDGRLTDTNGKVVDFTNSIIIATSNVGTRQIQEISARNGTFEEMRAAGMTEIRNRFAPEFLNRFTGIIVFKPLNKDTLNKITDLMLNGVRKIAENKGFKVSFKPEVYSELIRRGYDPEWGARLMARTIEDFVETYLSERILEGAIQPGDTIELGKEVFAPRS